MMGKERLPISIPEGVCWVLDRLTAAGYDAWLVGGCLRDLYLDAVPKDWDVACSALPGDVEGLFPRTAPTGIRYGTVTVLIEGMKVEVTTFRSEGAYGDSRHPDTVRFLSAIEEDLARRDFTVNAMAYHLERGWRDPYGGRADCDRGLIRCVGEPAARFSEDALRMLRAVRFASQLGFTLDGDTHSAIRKNAHAIENVAGERIREELIRILLAPNAGEGIRLLGDTGLGVCILPEAACEAFSWNPAAWPMDSVLRLSAWLCASCGEKQRVEEALARLRLDTQTSGDVLFLYDTRDIVPVPESEWVRRRLYAWGQRRVELYLKYQQAAGRETSAVRETLTGIRRRGECVSLKDLALNGTDLIRIGIEPGPAVGEALEQLMDAVLTDPGLNTKEKLTRYALDQFAKDT
jgi:tRNA nucleotidyltransferase (CCA-adding enzyme)